MLPLLLALALSKPFDVRIETTKGPVILEVHPEWAPRAAMRFRQLVESGYYDDSRFFRAVAGKWVQFGIAGDPARPRPPAFPDEDKDVHTHSNVRGTVAFAFPEHGRRAAQVFVNLADNARLDAQGFAPFARVKEGMDVLEKLYSGYGEDSGGGIRGGKQEPIYKEGNQWLDAHFPLLDRLIRATLL